MHLLISATYWTGPYLDINIHIIQYFSYDEYKFYVRNSVIQDSLSKSPSEISTNIQYISLNGNI